MQYNINEINEIDEIDEIIENDENNCADVIDFLTSYRTAKLTDIESFCESHKAYDLFYIMHVYILNIKSDEDIQQLQKFVRTICETYGELLSEKDEDGRNFIDYFTTDFTIIKEHDMVLYYQTILDVLKQFVY